MSSPPPSPTDTPPYISRPTWAEIDLGALTWNFTQLQSHCAATTGIIAVIKAGAYGHGAVRVARALANAAQPPRMLAVASVDEGVELRAAGITTPILLLSAILPGEAQAAAEADLTVTLYSDDVAQALNAAGEALGRKVAAHFKIDTGMGRLGCWHTEAGAYYRGLAQYPLIAVTGVYTHFSSADEYDDDCTPDQLTAFAEALAACGLSPGTSNGPMIHAANSAALLRYPRAHFDAVRPGLALYGASPLATNLDAPVAPEGLAPEGLAHEGVAPEGVAPKGVALKPVMTLRSRVTSVRKVAAGGTVSYGATWRAARPSVIATVPVGYADGFTRRLSQRASVLVRGACCPVAGRVTMDQLLVDCTELGAPLNVGDPVTLWGQGLPVERVAEWADTIAYELLCAVAKRVPRVYIED